MKASDAKTGTVLIVGGVEHKVVAVRSCPQPDRLVLEVQALDGEPVILSVHKEAKLAGIGDIPLDEARITESIRSILHRQLRKGLETYGKDYYAATDGEPLLHLFEELIDAMVYLYVAIERGKRA